MENFCPLCLKNGIKSRIRPYNVNLKEGVWACESVQCPWPFGCQELNFFQRNALCCDWTKDLLNVISKDSTPLLMESLYTPPMTPGEQGESSKESIDIATQCLSQLPVENVVSGLHHKNELHDATKDSNLEWLQWFEATSTEEKVIKTENKNMDVFCLETKPNNQNNDSTTLSSTNKYVDNQITQDCERLCTNTNITHTKDLNVINNVFENLDLSEQTSDITHNKCSKKSKQNESENVNTMNNMDNNINMPATTNLVGDADVMNIDMFENILLENYNVNENIDDDWLNALLS